uniref:Uncharacterized protein n=1 Tax=Oryza brachyantha TaxID=4533 RepID=J3M2L9_ORYBR
MPQITANGRTFDWWSAARRSFRTRYSASFDSLCLLSTWLIWKERNASLRWTFVHRPADF